MEHTAHRRKGIRTREKKISLPLLRASATAVGLSILLGIPLLLLGALFCLGRPDPVGAARGVGLGLGILLSLLSGILSVRFSGKSPFLAGSLTGLLWMLILLLFSSLSKEPGRAGILSLLFGLYPMLSATAGAFLGRKSASAPRKRKRR